MNEIELIELPCGCKGKPCLTGGFDVYNFCFYHGTLTGCHDILMKRFTGS